MPTWPESALDSSAVRVRPPRGAGAHRRWARLVAAHRYPAFAGLFGRELRQVVTLGGARLAGRGDAGPLDRLID